MERGASEGGSAEQRRRHSSIYLRHGQERIIHPALVRPVERTGTIAAEWPRFFTKRNAAWKIGLLAMNSSSIGEKLGEGASGIEPAHKGFAVLTATRNPLTRQAISVGFGLPKGVVLAPFGT